MKHLLAAFAKTFILILCVLAIINIFQKTIIFNAEEKKATKPLDNMTYGEAVLYTRAFEDGYRTCLLETIKVVVNSNGDARSIMEHLNNKAKEIYE